MLSCVCSLTLYSGANPRCSVPPARLLKSLFFAVGGSTSINPRKGQKGHENTKPTKGIKRQLPESLIRLHQYTNTVSTSLSRQRLAKPGRVRDSEFPSPIDARVKVSIHILRCFRGELSWQAHLATSNLHRTPTTRRHRPSSPLHDG
jgi:hypothetical protein